MSPKASNADPAITLSDTTRYARTRQTKPPIHNFHVEIICIWHSSV